MLIREALKYGLSELSERTNEPKESAEFLLSHTINEGFAYIRAHPERELTDEEESKYRGFIGKRKGRIPLWQIVGTDYFYGLPIYADSRVLVPRPETEFLVDKAIAVLKQEAGSRKQVLRILDIGTGSGAVACALAVNLPEADVTASDVSEEALEVAKLNFERNGLTDRIRLIRSDLFKEIGGKFDAVVANLPYVPEENLGGLSFEIHHYEPRVALAGGEKGVQIYGRFMGELPAHLSENAWVFLEIGEGQGDVVKKLAKEALPKSDIEVEQDLAGLDRYVLIHNS